MYTYNYYIYICIYNSYIITDQYNYIRYRNAGCFDAEYTADSIFKSSGHITGASGFSPKTWPGKILLMSWTWCIVLTLSAYTANLASFLVVSLAYNPSKIHQKPMKINENPWKTIENQ